MPDKTFVNTPEPVGEFPASTWRMRLGFGLLVAMLLMLIASKSVLYDTIDPDAFWHLRVAETIQQNGPRPIMDDISFMSVREPWTPYSWLAELGMKALWDTGGYRAAIVAQSVTIALMFLFVALTCVEMTRPPRPYMGIAAGVVFAAYLALPYLSFRPATLAMTLVALCVWLLARDRRKDERSGGVWCVPFVVAALINVHLFAFFVPMWIGALLVGALWERYQIQHWSERGEATWRVRRYLILLGLTLLACCATPMLPGLIKSITHYGKDDPMVSAQIIAELRPFYLGTMWPITAALLVGAAILFARRWKHFRAGEWTLLAIGAVGLLKMGRLAPLFVLIAAPMLAMALPMLQGKLLGRPIVWCAMLGLLVMGSMRVAGEFPDRSLPLAKWLNRHGPETPGYPCDAAQFVETNIAPVTGRIINDFNWGGYLAYELGPKFKVYMDARTQLYSAEFWNDTALGDERTMHGALASIKADAAIVPLKSQRMAGALKSLGWREVFQDDRAAVLVPPGSVLADTKE